MLKYQIVSVKNVKKNIEHVWFYKNEKWKWHDESVSLWPCSNDAYIHLALKHVHFWLSKFQCDVGVSFFSLRLWTCNVLAEYYEIQLFWSVNLCPAGVLLRDAVHRRKMAAKRCALLVCLFLCAFQSKYFGKYFLTITMKVHRENWNGRTILTWAGHSYNPSNSAQSCGATTS